MESTTILRRDHTLKKKNKENVQPVQEVKSFIKQNGSKSVIPPLQTNGNKKDFLAKTAKVGTVKQVARKQNISEHAPGKTTTLKYPITAKNPSHNLDSGLHGRKTELAAKPKKPVGETPKPSAVQPSKPAPGLYKGKIIESKIGSIWKSSVPVRNEDQKPTAQKAGNGVTSAAGRGTSAPSSRSVKPIVNSRPPNTFSSARPPVRSVPTIARPRNATVAQSRRCGTLIAKPKVPVTDTKARKPPVSSTVSQYRATNAETAEEKRAKLAEWLASKGKTLKRPAMVPSAASTKVKVANKPAAAPKSQMKAQLPTKSRSEAEVKEPKPVTPAPTADDHKVPQEEKSTSLIMNTTLDLLENSNLDLPVDPQESGNDGVDDIVMNLCGALEALEPPSQCDDELPQLKDDCSDEGNESKEECIEDVKSETPDNWSVKSEPGISDDQEVQDESEESDDCYMDENTPPTEEASVVKYSVKTTPYLQSVKKTIEGEVCSSTSKRKNNIKDIKFLTPVRRSSRIHRQSSRLPTMLVEHDPCVSSLAELVKLDDDANAYIYRKNPALLEDLPDQPKV